MLLQSASRVVGVVLLGLFLSTNDGCCAADDGDGSGMLEVSGSGSSGSEYGESGGAVATEPTTIPSTDTAATTTTTTTTGTITTTTITETPTSVTFAVYADDCPTVDLVAVKTAAENAVKGAPYDRPDGGRAAITLADLLLTITSCGVRRNTTTGIITEEAYTIQITMLVKTSAAARAIVQNVKAGRLYVRVRLLDALTYDLAQMTTTVTTATATTTTTPRAPSTTSVVAPPAPTAASSGSDGSGKADAASTNTDAEGTSGSGVQVKSTGRTNSAGAKAAGIVVGVLLLVLLLAFVLWLRRDPANKYLARQWFDLSSWNKPVDDQAKLSRRESIGVRRKSLNQIRASISVSEEGEGYTTAGSIPTLPMPELHVGDMVCTESRITSVYLVQAKAHLTARVAELLAVATELGFVPTYRHLCQIGVGSQDLAAKREVNKLKNRYLNITAYDHSRVHLPVINDDPDTDYINANWIDGYDHPRRYIASQGPVPNSFISFWRMIWHYKVQVIVMVTNEWERGMQKCHRYWPEPVHRGPKSLQFGLGIEVTHLSTEHHALWIVRSFSVKCEGETRILRQVAYTAWPDHGVPNHTEDLLLLRTYVNDLAKSSPKIGKVPPMVVHCSAGVGRTGTFIAVDRAINQALDMSEEEVDIDEIVGEMRAARNLMVQTEEQYLCIHSSVLDGISWLLNREQAAMRKESALGQSTGNLDDPVYARANPAAVSGYHMATASPLREESNTSNAQDEEAAEAAAGRARKQTDFGGGSGIERMSVLAHQTTFNLDGNPHGESFTSPPSAEAFERAEFKLSFAANEVQLRSVRRENPMFNSNRATAYDMPPPIRQPDLDAATSETTPVKADASPAVGAVAETVFQLTAPATLVAPMISNSPTFSEDGCTVVSRSSSQSHSPKLMRKTRRTEMASRLAAAAEKGSGSTTAELVAELAAELTPQTRITPPPDEPTLPLAATAPVVVDFGATLKAAGRVVTAAGFDPTIQTVMNVIRPSALQMMRDASDEVTFQYTDQPRMGPRHSFDVQMHGPGASLHHLPGTLSDPLGEGAEDPDADADMDVGGGLAALARSVSEYESADGSAPAPAAVGEEVGSTTWGGVVRVPTRTGARSSRSNHKPRALSIRTSSYSDALGGGGLAPAGTIIPDEEAEDGGPPSPNC
jgi:protein tyrosine phosphatase